ncbi:MAG: antibiotic biosynthesis monooxygenase [Actinomycetota bacterium]|nr:antibiotic biosynthesis monooxygenase [Actinomycetota bacterium]
MSAKVIFEFRFKATSLEDGLAELATILVDTRKFNGCLGVEVVRDVNDSEHFVLVESWESTEDYKAYSTWRAGDGKTNLGSFFAGPPSITIYEVTQV